jgi:hypothetical protein
MIITCMLAVAHAMQCCCTTAGVSPDVSHLLCCILPMLVVTLDVLTQSYKALQRQSVPLSGCPSSFGLVSFALL